MLDIEPSPTPLERKEWNKHLDHFLATGKFNPDLVPYLDAFQQGVINEIKKAYKRIENKQ